MMCILCTCYQWTYLISEEKKHEKCIWNIINILNDTSEIFSNCNAIYMQKHLHDCKWICPQCGQHQRIVTKVSHAMKILNSALPPNNSRLLPLPKPSEEVLPCFLVHHQQQREHQAHPYAVVSHGRAFLHSVVGQDLEKDAQAKGEVERRKGETVGDAWGGQRNA